MNVNNDRAADKTSRIKPDHILGLLALNPAPTKDIPSSLVLKDMPSSLVFEPINASDMAPFSAPGDTAMLETESESEMEVNSTGTSSSVLMKQVCLI